jgi:hypothetical protein
VETKKKESKSKRKNEKREIEVKIVKYIYRGKKYILEKKCAKNNVNTHKLRRFGYNFFLFLGRRLIC